MWENRKINTTQQYKKKESSRMQQQSSAHRRLNVYLNHLYNTSTTIQHESCNNNNNTVSVNANDVIQFMYNEDFPPEEIDKVFKLFNSSEFMRDWLYSQGLQEARSRAHAQTALLLGHPEMKTVLDDPTKIVMRIAMCSLLNSSIGTKVAAQCALFAGSLVNLGTQRHAHLVPDAECLKLVGCFAMTELKKGSNVRGIQVSVSCLISDLELIELQFRQQLHLMKEQKNLLLIHQIRELQSGGLVMHYMQLLQLYLQD
jgi:hypothetical protein